MMPSVANAETGIATMLNAATHPNSLPLIATLRFVLDRSMRGLMWRNSPALPRKTVDTGSRLWPRVGRLTGPMRLVDGFPLLHPTKKQSLPTLADWSAKNIGGSGAGQ